MTNPNYQRLSRRRPYAEQALQQPVAGRSALTMQTNPSYFPGDGVRSSIRTGREFNEASKICPLFIKANGSYSFPWDITASANLNIQKARHGTVSINGPVKSMAASTRRARHTISYGTPRIEPRGTYPVRAGQAAGPWRSKGDPVRWRSAPS